MAGSPLRVLGRVSCSFIISVPLTGDPWERHQRTVPRPAGVVFCILCFLLWACTPGGISSFPTANPAVHHQPSSPPPAVLLCSALLRLVCPALPLFPLPHALFTFVPANTTLLTDPRSLLSLVSFSGLFKSFHQPADYPL